MTPTGSPATEAQPESTLPRGLTCEERRRPTRPAGLCPVRRPFPRASCRPCEYGIPHHHEVAEAQPCAPDEITQVTPGVHGVNDAQPGHRGDRPGLEPPVMDATTAPNAARRGLGHHVERVGRSQALGHRQREEVQRRPVTERVRSCEGGAERGRPSGQRRVRLVEAHDTSHRMPDVAAAQPPSTHAERPGLPNGDRAPRHTGGKWGGLHGPQPDARANCRRVVHRPGRIEWPLRRPPSGQAARTTELVSSRGSPRRSATPGRPRRPRQPSRGINPGRDCDQPDVAPRELMRWRGIEDLDDLAGRDVDIDRGLSIGAHPAPPDRGGWARPHGQVLRPIAGRHRVPIDPAGRRDHVRCHDAALDGQSDDPRWPIHGRHRSGAHRPGAGNMARLVTGGAPLPDRPNEERGVACVRDRRFPRS